jgi:hypothetical protein
MELEEVPPLSHIFMLLVGRLLLISCLWTTNSRFESRVAKPIAERLGETWVAYLIIAVLYLALVAVTFCNMGVMLVVAFFAAKGALEGVGFILLGVMRALR